MSETFIAPGDSSKSKDDTDTDKDTLPGQASLQESSPTEETIPTEVTLPGAAVSTEEVDVDDTVAGALIISYEKDSWTDVRDANGKKLLYRTVKAGEKIALAGPAPLSLFFGFAQGVRVTFNGKEVDVPAHTRGVFARFTVGEAVNQ